MRASVALRAACFLVLMPGTVAGYLPGRLLLWSGATAPAWSLPTVAAAIAGGIGVALLLASAWEFLVSGRGTLAPVDPPRQLVVTGLYRCTRNPMYNGVALTLLGEAGAFASLALLLYAVAVVLAFHLFVVLYEEPTLARRFGAAYLAYRQAVPRWGLRWPPYSPPAAARGVGR